MPNTELVLPSEDLLCLKFQSALVGKHRLAPEPGRNWLGVSS